MNEELEKLSKCSKKELEHLCKTKNLKITGNKITLAKRYLKNKIFSHFSPLRLDFISCRINNLDLYHNLENNILYDPIDEIICGKLTKDNKIVNLTKKDIEFCKDLKLPYDVPNILKGETIKIKRNKNDELYEDSDSE